jgi:hypothetical protein
LVWLYLLTKLLVFDLDRALLDRIVPGLGHLVDYRLLVYLLLLALIAAFWHKVRFFVLYVGSYPIVLTVKAVLWLARHRSWFLFLALLQAASMVLSDLRYNLIAKPLALVAALVILFLPTSPLTLVSAFYLGCLLALTLLRRFRRIARAPSFVEVQRRTIEAVMANRAVKSLTELAPEYKDPEVEAYDSTQANHVTLAISWGIGIDKVLLIWASQLEKYRRRAWPTLAFDAVSAAWLFVIIFGTVTLLNYALMQLDPTQFKVDSPRPFIAVLVYSLSTITLGAAGGATPVGQIAYAMQLAGLAGGIFVGGAFAADVIQSFVRQRNERATADLVLSLRAAARSAEERFRSQYDVDVDEGYRRLVEMGVAYAGLLGYLMRSLPVDAGGNPDIT